MAKGYNIIIGKDIYELQGLVEQHLKAGWQLVGGAAFVADRDEAGDGNGWVQTLLHPSIDGEE